MYQHPQSITEKFLEGNQTNTRYEWRSSTIWVRLGESCVPVSGCKRFRPEIGHNTRVFPFFVDSFIDGRKRT